MPPFLPTSSDHFSTTRTFSTKSRPDAIAVAVSPLKNSPPMGQVRNLG
jgi:hypothetical protein